MPGEPKGGRSSAYSVCAGEPAIHAFQRSKRLRKTDEISSVFSFKCQAYGDCLRVLVRPNQLEHPRLAVIVSKKTVARAVDRNYIKRSLREVFRLHQNLFARLDIVVQARKGYTRNSIGRVQEEFLELVSRLQKRLS